MRKTILVTLLTCFMFSCESESAPKMKTTQWCGEAFEDLEKLMTALKDTVPKGERDAIFIPKRSTYIQQCHFLPLKAQKCLAVGFAQLNISECRNLNLRGEDKKNFELLLSGK